MRVIVSGGTGFVGRALGHALVARGDQVVVLTRGPARKATHACTECAPGGNYELVTWTPDAAGPWMDLVDSADAVVHLAGASIVGQRWTEERKRRLRTSRIASAGLLAEAIAGARRRPAAFVSGSAVGYYGIDTGDRILTEDDPAGGDFLATLAADWEKAAEPARAAGVRTCHPRLGLVLGHAGGVHGKLAPLFRAFVGGPVGSGRQWLSWVHLRDVTRALVAMITRADLSGPYNVVAPEAATMDAFAEALGASLHRPWRVRVPAAAVRLAMGSEAAQTLLEGQRVLPKRLVDAGFAFVFPDLRSALEDLADGARSPA